jgi:hypothetical protein
VAILYDPLCSRRVGLHAVARWCLLAFGLLAGLEGVRAAAPFRISSATVSRAPWRPNLVPNPGFEESLGEDWTTDWQWRAQATGMDGTLDRVVFRTGRCSVRLIRPTDRPVGAFGVLRCKSEVRLSPGRTYTFSLYVRSGRAGRSWFGSETDVRRRAPLPTGDTWQRAQFTFTADEADKTFAPAVGLEGSTAAIWIDDVKLEEGADATSVLDGARAGLIPSGSNVVQPGDGPFALAWDLFLPERVVGGRLRSGMDGSPALLEIPVTLGRGAWRITVPGQIRGMDDSPHRLWLTLSAPESATLASQVRVRILSATAVRRRLNALGSRISRIRRSVEFIDPQWRTTAAFDISQGVLSTFAAAVAEALSVGQVYRARELLAATEEVERGLETRVSEALHRSARPSGSAGHQPAAQPERAARPAFLIGYGHFGLVRRDVETLARCGANLIQVEVGPDRLLPRPDTPDLAPVREIRALLDRAARVGVRVDLLISPHYHPKWLLERYPHLRVRREGFLQYCIHAPKGMEMLRRAVQTLLRPLRGHPALHSVCLSNEPRNVEAPCGFAAGEWHRWLRHRHGTIEVLNTRWGTRYGDFEAISLPDPYRASDREPPTPRWYEFVRFNSEWFASWHEKLAQAVHTAAPGLPVHAKIMTWSFMHSAEVSEGIDPTLLAEVTDFNGQTAHTLFRPGVGEFAADWQESLAACDLQWSVKRTPVFNSENHLLPDGDAGRIPARHFRAALWQAAVHGQGATTLWAWERSTEPGSTFAGSLADRPAAVEAVGRVCRDLNRLAPQVQVLLQAPARAMILHGTTTRVWDGDRSAECERQLYTILAFAGLKTGFVTESQLEAGHLPAGPPILVPNIRHLSDAAFRTLAKYAGRVIAVGDAPLLDRDEYDRERSERLATEVLPYQSGASGWRDLLRARFPPCGIELYDSSGGAPRGVAWLSVASAESDLVSICNYTAGVVVVGLRRKGRPAQGIDLFTGKRLGPLIELRSLEVAFIRLVSVRRGNAPGQGSALRRTSHRPFAPPLRRWSR